MSAKQFKTVEDRKGWLRHLPLFSTLGAAEIAAISEMSVEQFYPKGKLLMLHGDPADHFFIVADGWIKLFRETLDGQETVAGLATVGDSFGEAVIFKGASYPFSAEAVEDAVMLKIPGAVLTRLVQQDFSFGARMMKEMSDRLQRLELKVEHIAAMNAAQRVGCFLLSLCRGEQEKNTSLKLPVDKSLVAASLGMKPETFSRALAQLKEVGVQVKGASVQVESIDKLRDFTCISCSNTERCDEEN